VLRICKLLVSIGASSSSYRLGDDSLGILLKLQLVVEALVDFLLMCGEEKFTLSCICDLYSYPRGMSTLSF
jgi:hypothetical protein